MTTTTAAEEGVPPEPAWPRALADVTTEWLSSALGGTVVSYTSKVLEGGALADTALIDVKYAAGAEGKTTSVVLKYAKGMQAGRDFAMMSNAYKKECNFYADLKDKVGVQVPKVFGVFRDEEKPDHGATLEWFCIIMENMSVEADVLDGITGLEWKDQCQLLQTVAKMHGRMYKSPELDQEWLDATGADGHWSGFWVNFAQMFMGAPASGEEMRVKAQEAIDLTDPTIKWFSEDIYPEWGKIVDLLAGTKGAAVWEVMLKTLDSRPKTLCHGDLRSDNVFKSKTDETDLRLIDWQLLSAGPCGTDLVQALSFSLKDLSDYQKIDELIAYFHGCLAEANAELAQAYTIEMVKEDFQIYQAMLVMGYSAIIAPYVTGMHADGTPKDHDLWRLTRMIIPRMGEL